MEKKSKEIAIFFIFFLLLSNIAFGISTGGYFSFNGVSPYTNFNFSILKKMNLDSGSPIKSGTQKKFKFAILNLNDRAWKYNSKKRYSYFSKSRVGIGVSSPEAKLHLRTWGNSYFINQYKNGVKQVFVATANGIGMNLGNDWNKSFFINKQGYTGIGTIAPKEKLDVNGNLFVKDDVYANSFRQSSDIRLKTNIRRLKKYKDILKVNAISFDWKKNNQHDVGIIAQEVQRYFPEFVKPNRQGILSVDYSKLSVPMLNLLQEHEMRLKIQEMRNYQLSQKLIKQEKEIQDLKNTLVKLQKDVLYN